MQGELSQILFTKSNWPVYEWNRWTGQLDRDCHAIGYTLYSIYYSPTQYINKLITGGAYRFGIV